ncbi:platelet basic protein-like isoform X2 [Anabas testudineus]|uniref:platelet basic protein-like isoform X2 n=1 Tax=Anabas testudineus TaxID=64144 RepID=UPI000E455D5D|nr:platelet basic protein-like isoform X2 [Anabas testudineus]
MKTALPRIVLLACMVMCVTVNAILQCQCIKTSEMVNPSQIVDIKVNEPSSYCSRKEVIVQLKNNISMCLDAKAPFTIRLLKEWDEKIKNTIYSKCRCVKTSKMVNPSQIVRVEVINQGFYCRRIEVIAQLKNNLSVCLDPKAPFIIRILKKLDEKMKNTTVAQSLQTHCIVHH